MAGAGLFFKGIIKEFLKRDLERTGRLRKFRKSCPSFQLRANAQPALSGVFIAVRAILPMAVFYSCVPKYQRPGMQA